MKVMMNIDAMYDTHPDTIGRVLRLIGHKEEGYLDEADTLRFRKCLVDSLRACQDITPRAKSNLCEIHEEVPDLWQRVAKDPDWAVMEWRYTGAPSGLTADIHPCSIFQLYDAEEDCVEFDVEDLATQPHFTRRSRPRSCEEVI